MKLFAQNADVFVPGVPGSATTEELVRALGGVTHVVVGAHPDDAEVGALPAISMCRKRGDLGLCAVILTDGRNPPLSGPYRHLPPERMVKIRIEEQRQAALVGGYRAVIQLCYCSDELKPHARRSDAVADIAAILDATRCEELWLHQPFDRHPTHGSAFFCGIGALGRLPRDKRPRRLFGMEVWGTVDCLPADQLEEFDVSCDAELLERLLEPFKSQNAAKDYQSGVRGRQTAHATFRQSHATNGGSRVCLAVKLHDFLENPELDVRSWVTAVHERALHDLHQRLGCA